MVKVANKKFTTTSFLVQYIQKRFRTIFELRMKRIDLFGQNIFYNKKIIYFASNILQNTPV